MRILLWKEILLLMKKIFTANYFNAPNNIAVSTTANDNALGEKSWLLKTMLHLSNAFQKLTA